VDSTSNGSSVWTQRLETLGRRAADEGLDAVVVASDWRYKGNLRYFTNRVLWSRWAYIVVRPELAPVLVMIAPSQQYWAREEGPIADVRFGQSPIEEVVSVLREGPVANARVGIAGLGEIMRPHDFRVLESELPQAEFTDATRIIDAMRTLKTADEVSGVRNTMRIAEEAFDLFGRKLRPGLSRWEIVGEVERILRGSGSYDTMLLLSTGPYLREPAAGAFGPGDVVMFSIELAGPEGYWVERGGTFCVGEPDEPLLRLYQACSDALAVAVSLLRPHMTAGTLAHSVDETLTASGFEKGIWGGHGIGLDVLERPILLPESADTIEQDSVIAFHPHVVDRERGRGAYISDTYLVAEDATTGLAEIPHELKCVAS
jgi:Xaa-Pro aminopeptidase